MKSTYRNKKVIITGHTGFKGSWLSLWLNSLGAELSGISIDIPSTPSNYIASNLPNFIEDNRVDIRDLKRVKEIIDSYQPDFIFHLAAQSLVRPSYSSPIETIEINAIGSANVLEAVRALNKKVNVVMITSDKAYNNHEWPWGYKETDELGGSDPYSASKGMAELAIRSYVSSFLSKNSKVNLAIARAGNVIGGGDWARDRIVPDCMRAWSLNDCVDIRSPNSTRPWQHVLEPLSGYLMLGMAVAADSKFHGEAYNFGPSSNQDYSVKDLIDEMEKYWENVKWNDTSDKSQTMHEAGLLKLNCDKALHDHGWIPTLNFQQTVKMTVEWYKEFYQSGSEASMYDFTSNQIKEYTALAMNQHISWAVK